MKDIIFVVVLLSFTFFLACKKKEGVGGKASINGKVHVKQYNKTFSSVISEYYGQNVQVFIIYGTELDYGSSINTNYDGAYEFKYLRPGNYKIYTYSKDSTQAGNGKIAVIQEIHIPKNNSVVVADDLEIIN